MRASKQVAMAVAMLIGCGVAAGCAEQPRGPALADEHRCEQGAVGKIDPPPGVEFSCATLAVPLDHGLMPGERVERQLSLPVAMTENATAPRGVLVWMSGGPGSPGVPLAGEIASQFAPEVLREYRLVLFSTRGTGPTALHCPGLQQSVDSSSDVAPPGIIEDCARSISPDRRFYGSADTVADMEDLRQALGVDKMTVAGASYGTVPASRYAMKYPDRVARLVLDSVVPHDGLDPLMMDIYPRAAQVLRDTCVGLSCPTDPASDLAEVVRVRHNGTAMLDLVTNLAPKPRIGELVTALREAARGDGRKLDALIADRNKPKGPPPPPEKYSRALNITTSCQDIWGPWSGVSSPVAGRTQAAAQAVAALPEQAFFPFDRATALENGTLVNCARFPKTTVPPFALGRDLPPVPTLLLAGDRDLVTPLGWTQKEASLAPKSRLVLIPGAGTSPRTSPMDKAAHAR